MITEFYAKLLTTMPEGLDRKILDVLIEHVGEENKISLDDLTVKVLGVANTTTMRQVREAMEAMRRQHVPVLSNSGTPGRWLAANQEEITKALNELYNRRDSINLIIRGMETTRLPDESKPQMALF